MAEMSLSGNACPSQPGAKAKEPVPENIVNAIRSMCFMILQLNLHILYSK
jgi:hypothetical protein